MAKKSAAKKKTAARRPAPKRAVKAAARPKKAPAKKAPARKAAPAARAAAGKTAKKAARTVTKKVTKKVTRKAAPARKAAPKKAVAARPAAKKAPARKVAARAAVVRKAAPKAAPKAATKPAPKARVTTKPAAKAAPTRTPAPARHVAAIDRERRTVADVPTAPSSLVANRHASAASSGADELRVRLASHTGTGPAITAGDVDANWEAAETVGDEAPGGDNPTPDQDVVDEIGKALGVEYDDDEELQGGDEIAARDHDRWELDPASSDDFDER